MKYCKIDNRSLRPILFFTGWGSDKTGLSVCTIPMTF